MTTVERTAKQPLPLSLCQIIPNEGGPRTLLLYCEPIDMLSLYSSELARRSTWTCLSCSGLFRTSQAMITGPPNGSLAHAHQRKHSSSKTPSPPKDGLPAITTPSDNPSKDVKPVVKESTEKRPSTRISKRKLKDGVQDTAGKSSNELTFNLPSVPTTNHLHAIGMAFHPLR